MYEWLANEKITSYQREAAEDQRLRLAETQPRFVTPSTMTTPVPSSRRALAAAFVGLAAMGVLRHKR
ncbi:MAG: hypothetical protein ACYDAB_00900 [bacterium]